MITRRSLFGVLGAIPFLSFLKEKEPKKVWFFREPKTTIQGVLDEQGLRMAERHCTIKPDAVIMDGKIKFLNGDVANQFCDYYWEKRDFKPIEIEKIANRLIQDGFVVEIHHSDGTKEIRYRL